MAIDPAKTGGQLAVAADDLTLAEITRRLVETYRPERIYLFASRARGTASAASDHQGDESTFVARRQRGAQRVSTSEAPRPPGGAAARTRRGRPRQRGFRNGGRGTGRVPGGALQGWAPVTDGWE